jgi:exodeoxyribonuclease VII small subunit
MTSDLSSLTFEAAFGQLEQVVQQLEVGGLGLEEAIQLYEQGMALVAACSEKIQSAELRLVRMQDLPEEPPF